MSGAVGSATMAAAVLSSSLAAVAASSPSSTTTGTTAAAGGQLTAVLVDLSNKDKNFAKLLKNAHVAKELLAPEVKNKKRLATLYAVMGTLRDHPLAVVWGLCSPSPFVLLVVHRGRKRARARLLPRAARHAFPGDARGAGDTGREDPTR